MGQPIWNTPSGDLGTIAEGLFFSTPVKAVDPDGGIVKYKLIAGNLPEGIQVKSNGTVEGVPQAFAKVQGVPVEVSENVTSKFAIRAYVELLGGTIRLSDRTFSLTVTGQDLPEFVTPAGSIGLYYDGNTINYQIEFTDQDPGDNVVVSLEDGELPEGVTISAKGLISGYIKPLTNLPDTAEAGFDRENSAWDQYPFDFASRSISKNYQFTLQITDGKDRSQRTFEMYVVSRDSLTADTTDFTADNNNITADVLPQRTPFISNYPTDGYIGKYRHSNFFAYQIQSLDLDGDQVEYMIAVGDSVDLPPGLSFNTETGWLYGYLPDQGSTENKYQFSIYVYKKENPSIISPAYTYSMTTVGDIDIGVVWVTPADLGTINNGDVSIYQIVAQTESNRVLFYRLKEGSYPDTPGYYNKLPQGLELLSSGNISGRVSFNTFALDGGTTTFDQSRATRLSTDPTTFDSKFTFTVEAYSQDGLISVFKTFTIVVNRKFNEPYEGLYVEAMPPLEDRAVLSSLLQNQDIIPPSFIYRRDDPYFGVSRDVKYVHAYGLKSATLEQYYESLDLNHYRKQLILGDLKVAQATDANGNVVYEVVYSDIIDSGVNDAGESPPQSVPVPYPFFDQDGSTYITEVYPNSLIEMRNQVIDVVGQYADVLPRWMTSKQANGRVLGFTKAWVLAYCLPGKGEQLAYNINNYWNNKLNNIDFDVDRYVLERQYSKWWEAWADSTEDGRWRTAEATTFDLVDKPSNLVDLGTVDFATNLAFIDVNNQTLQHIQNLGGIDGINGSLLNNKTLIFVKQENFPNYTNAQAFADYPITYDMAGRTTPPYISGMIGFDVDGQPFDSLPYGQQTMVYISGGPDPADGTIGTYDVGGFDPEPTYLDEAQRLAIYRMNVIDGNYIRLTLVREVEVYDYVTVQYGNQYSKVQLYIPNAPTVGLLRRTWSLIPESAGAETTFDGGSIRFISPVDMYGLTDEYNKYLVFPKTNILG